MSRKKVSIPSVKMEGWIVIEIDSMVYGEGEVRIR
jgi:hypothetical protein